MDLATAGSARGPTAVAISPALATSPATCSACEPLTARTGPMARFSTSARQPSEGCNPLTSQGFDKRPVNVHENNLVARLAEELAQEPSPHTACTEDDGCRTLLHGSHPYDPPVPTHI